MKKLLLTLVAFCAALAAAAQTPDTTAAEGYRFTDVKLIPMTPVKDQSRSGTCWCYSTLSFLEGEILRAGGAPVHLSEMWIVRHTFMEKAVKYIRMHGEINFAEGGASRDVTEGIRNYGIVPFEAYPGFNYGTEKADFHELSLVLKAYLDAVMEASTKSSNKPLSTALQRHPERIFRPDARDLHLSGQGIHAPDVRRLAADRHRRLYRHQFVHTPPLLYAVHHRGAR